MPKVRLDFGAEIDLLNKDELAGALADAGGWEKEAAFGLRHGDLPVMSGKASAGTLALGADQAGQVQCGPGSGNYWAVTSVCVDGLATGDAVKVYKMTRFKGWVLYQPGFQTWGAKGFVLKSGEYIRVTGTGLTTTATVSVYGEYISVPGPLMWKIIGGG